MKLITLNTHSLIEKDYEQKLRYFAEMMIKEDVDVVALQEVNQRMDEAAVSPLEHPYYVAAEPEAVCRRGNHALRLANLLTELGVKYYWSWVPIKISYDTYTEGAAIFSKEKIEDIQSVWISINRVHEDWAARKALGIKVKNNWFYSVHTGWWDDKREPFWVHWDTIREAVRHTCKTGEKCFVMGDFNCPADIRNEGYDYVENSGWFDTYKLAKKKDAGTTARRKIDGWSDRTGNAMRADEGLRIDYIWCSHMVDVEESRVVANGKCYPVMSDHYGVEVFVE